MAFCSLVQFSGPSKQWIINKTYHKYYDLLATLLHVQESQKSLTVILNRACSQKHDEGDMIKVRSKQLS